MSDARSSPHRLQSFRVTDYSPAHRLEVSLKKYSSTQPGFPRAVIDPKVTYESLGWPDPTRRGSYQWHIDHPSLWHGYRTGPISPCAPDGHPRRCQGARRGTDPARQCARWARPGQCYCIFHLRKKSAAPPKNNRLMTSYARRASPALKELLESQRRDGPEEHSLSDEITVARALMEKAMQMYDKAQFGIDKDGKPYSAAIRAAATENVRLSMRNVQDLVQSSARVRATDQLVVDAAQIRAFTSSVLVAIDRVLGHDQHLLKQVVDAIQGVALPKRVTAMTPDELAEATRRSLAGMDSTIGALPAHETSEATTTPTTDRRSRG